MGQFIFSRIDPLSRCVRWDPFTTGLTRVSPLKCILGLSQLKRISNVKDLRGHQLILASLKGSVFSTYEHPC